MNAPRIYICYSTGDEKEVAQFVKKLNLRGLVNVWAAYKDMSMEVDSSQISHQIRQSDFFIPFITWCFNNDDILTNEINIAVEQSANKPYQFIIPVIFENFQPINLALQRIQNRVSYSERDKDLALAKIIDQQMNFFPQTSPDDPAEIFIDINVPIDQLAGDGLGTIEDKEVPVPTPVHPEAPEPKSAGEAPVRIEKSQKKSYLFSRVRPYAYHIGSAINGTDLKVSDGWAGLILILPAIYAFFPHFNIFLYSTLWMFLLTIIIFIFFFIALFVSNKDNFTSAKRAKIIILLCLFEALMLGPIFYGARCYYNLPISPGILDEYDEYELPESLGPGKVMYFKSTPLNKSGVFSGVVVTKHARIIYKSNEFHIKIMSDDGRYFYLSESWPNQALYFYDDVVKELEVSPEYKPTEFFQSPSRIECKTHLAKNGESICLAETSTGGYIYIVAGDKKLELIPFGNAFFYKDIFHRAPKCFISPTSRATQLCKSSSGDHFLLTGIEVSPLDLIENTANSALLRSSFFDSIKNARYYWYGTEQSNFSEFKKEVFLYNGQPILLQQRLRESEGNKNEILLSSDDQYFYKSDGKECLLSIDMVLKDNASNRILTSKNPTCSDLIFLIDRLNQYTIYRFTITISRRHTTIVIGKLTAGEKHFFIILGWIRKKHMPKDRDCDFKMHEHNGEKILSSDDPQCRDLKIIFKYGEPANNQ